MLQGAPQNARLAFKDPAELVNRTGADYETPEPILNLEARLIAWQDTLLHIDYPGIPQPFAILTPWSVDYLYLFPGLPVTILPGETKCRESLPL